MDLTDKIIKIFKDQLCHICKEPAIYVTIDTGSLILKDQHPYNFNTYKEFQHYYFWCKKHRNKYIEESIKTGIGSTGNKNIWVKEKL